VPQPPRRERRTGQQEDTGQRRRQSDDTLDRLEAWMEKHDEWARDLAARLDSRLASVERRADLLDGRAGNDGGIIGKLGEVSGELKALRADVADVKAKTGAVDGQKPPGRWERILTVAGPILVVLITTIGGIVVAYFALRGQLAGLQPTGRTP
jgi:hypothetical protein